MYAVVTLCGMKYIIDLVHGNRSYVIIIDKQQLSKCNNNQNNYFAGEFSQSILQLQF